MFWVRHLDLAACEARDGKLAGCGKCWLHAYTGVCTQGKTNMAVILNS